MIDWRNPVSAPCPLARVAGYDLDRLALTLAWIARRDSESDAELRERLIDAVGDLAIVSSETL